MLKPLALASLIAFFSCPAFAQSAASMGAVDPALAPIPRAANATEATQAAEENIPDDQPLDAPDLEVDAGNGRTAFIPGRSIQQQQAQPTTVVISSHATLVGEEPVAEKPIADK